VKVPAIIATGIICLALGVGVGAVGMANIEFLLPKPPTGNNDMAGGPPSTSPDDMRAPGGPRGPFMPPGGGPPGGGFPGGGPPGGGRGPNPKNQLASLVTKLDQLTEKPLAITLTTEQQAKLSEQLKGIDEKSALTDEDAKKCLDAVLEIVQGDRDTLETAGFRWPGEGGGPRPPSNAPNPFTEPDNGKHLKALKERVTKDKGN